MMNPFFIKKPDKKLMLENSFGESPATKAYFDRLIRLIPAEVIALYTTGIAIIPPEGKIVRLIWTFFCFACVVLVRIFGSRSPQRKIQWPIVAISSASFVIWIYNGRGIFEDLGLYVNYIGGLFMLGWTFLIPFIYQGSNDE